MVVKFYLVFSLIFIIFFYFYQVQIYFRHHVNDLIVKINQNLFDYGLIILQFKNNL